MYGITIEVYRRREGKCFIYFRGRTVIAVILDVTLCNMVEVQVRRVSDVTSRKRAGLLPILTPVRTWKLASDRVYHNCASQISCGQYRVGVGVRRGPRLLLSLVN
jgi:hypothetical protein